MTDSSVPKEVCQITDRIIKDNTCYGKFNGELATSISTLCNNNSTLTNTNCKKFCDNQVGSGGQFKGACKGAAASYCEDSKNKSKPECQCIAYKDTPEYKGLLAKYGQSLATVNPQCWAPACLLDTWSDKMSSFNGTCPNTIQICAQSLNVSELTADAVGSIGSVCNLDSNQGSTTVITGATPARAPAPVPTPSTDPPKGSTENSKTKANPNGLPYKKTKDESMRLYTDKTDDPLCATNWNYYNEDGTTLILGNIPRLTKQDDTKNWCLKKPIPSPAPAPDSTPSSTPKPASTPPPAKSPSPLPSTYPFGLSQGAFIGISVGGGIFLILILFLLFGKKAAPAAAAPVV